MQLDLNHKIDILIAVGSMCVLTFIFSLQWEALFFSKPATQLATLVGRTPVPPSAENLLLKLVKPEDSSWRPAYLNHKIYMFT